MQNSNIFRISRKMGTARVKSGRIHETKLNVEPPSSQVKKFRRSDGNKSQGVVLPQTPRRRRKCSRERFFAVASDFWLTGHLIGGIRKTRMSEETVAEPQINEVLRLVDRLTKNGEHQMTILTWTPVVARHSCGVVNGVAMPFIERVFDEPGSAMHSLPIVN
jgi:hypothetical protein